MVLILYVMTSIISAELIAFMAFEFLKPLTSWSDSFLMITASWNSLDRACLSLNMRACWNLESSSLGMLIPPSWKYFTRVNRPKSSSMQVSYGLQDGRQASAMKKRIVFPNCGVEL